MPPFSSRPLSLAAAMLCLAALPALAADEADAPKGATVTVLKATKACFPAIVEVSGIVRARDEPFVRPGRGGGLVSIIARNEFALIGLVPPRDIGKLKVNQLARVKVIGAPEVDGKVTRVAPTIQPDSQLGQVTLAITSNQRLLVNSSGRALIKTGQSCGVSVPLTAVLYGTAGTVVQVVRRQRIETKRVEVGLMSGGQVEIRDGLVEGDMVVARAGALLREGGRIGRTSC